MTFTPKHWLAVALLVAALVGSVTLKDQAQPLMIGAVIGLFVILMMSGGGGQSLNGIVEALQRAANGESVRAPANASEELARLFEEISVVAQQRKKELSAARARQTEVEEAEKTLADLTRKLGEGVRTAKSVAAARQAGWPMPRLVAMRHAQAIIAMPGRTAAPPKPCSRKSAIMDPRGPARLVACCEVAVLSEGSRGL